MNSTECTFANKIFRRQHIILVMVHEKFHILRDNGINVIESHFIIHQKFEPSREKTNNEVSEQIRQKPSCTSTEDDYRPEISDLESRGIVLSV